MPTVVAVLPGIMGSRLRFPNSDRYWDPDSTRRMLWWLPVPLVNPRSALAAALHRDEPAEVIEDESDFVADGEKHRGWEGLSSEHYLKHLRGLDADLGTGADVRGFGYDWRQDITALGRTMAARLLAAAGADELVLVTHSMGGLVARSAVAQSPELAAKVRGVVHVCPPSCGAVVLYRRFFTGTEFRVDGGFADLPLLWILGDDADEFALTASGLPGAVQLLPSPSYSVLGEPWNPFLGTPPEVHAMYEADRWPPGLGVPDLPPKARAALADRAREVRAFHTTLGDRFHPNTWVICGDGLPTDATVVTDRGTLTFANPRPQNGDGTVPLASASFGIAGTQATLGDGNINASDARLWIATGLEHATAMANVAVMKAVVRILQPLL